ncbi:MAG: hypothetical protein J7K98_01980 [Candidatus Aenigmarchaeota archaeon]|nr:hypothetical protein [Candidatus Aenigmarchaeota archaeon]
MRKKIKEMLDKTDVDDKIIEAMKDFRKEFKKNLATFISGAFGFVAALVWRDTIRQLIDRIVKTEFIQSLIPMGEEWILQFVTAIIVTIIAVLGIFVVTKFLRTEE